MIQSDKHVDNLVIYVIKILAFNVSSFILIGWKLLSSDVIGQSHHFAISLQSSWKPLSVRPKPLCRRRTPIKTVISVVYKGTPACVEKTWCKSLFNGACLALGKREERRKFGELCPIECRNWNRLIVNPYPWILEKKSKTRDRDRECFAEKKSRAQH